jgi:hypothetical protein
MQLSKMSEKEGNMNRYLFVPLACLFVLALFVCPPASGGSGAENLPKGWMHAGDHPDNYEMTVDTAMKHDGKASARITFIGEKAEGFGTLMQIFKADDYRGKRVAMSAWMKTKDAESGNFWLRIDGVDTSLGFDNMFNRAVRGTTEWKEYEIVLDVPEEAVNIAFGAFVAGKGQAWVDDFSFKVVGETALSGAKPTPEQVKAKELAGSAKKHPRKPVNLDFEG